MRLYRNMRAEVIFTIKYEKKNVTKETTHQKTSTF